MYLIPRSWTQRLLPLWLLRVRTEQEYCPACSIISMSRGLEVVEGTPQGGLQIAVLRAHPLPGGQVRLRRSGQGWPPGCPPHQLSAPTGTPPTRRQPSGRECPCGRCCGAHSRWVLRSSLHSQGSSRCMSSSMCGTHTAPPGTPSREDAMQAQLQKQPGRFHPPDMADMGSQQQHGHVCVGGLMGSQWPGPAWMAILFQRYPAIM